MTTDLSPSEIQELKRLAEAATARGWRVRSVRYGAQVVEAELMCMNGLRAWFTVAIVHARDDQEILMSEGALAVAKKDAALIAAARNHLPALLDELERRRKEETAMLTKVHNDAIMNTIIYVTKEP